MDSDNLQCPVCYQLRYMFMVCKDGHNACRGCAESVRRSRNPRCPICQQHMLDAFLPNRVVMDVMLANAIVPCALASRGCDMYLRAEEVAAHASACHFRTVPCANAGCDFASTAGEAAEHAMFCPHMLVQCPNACGDTIKLMDEGAHCLACPCRAVACTACGSGMAAKDMDDHIAAACPERIVPCLFDGCFATFPLSAREEHARTACAMRDVACPNGCGDVRHAGDMDAHARDACELRPMPCPNAGCSAKVPRRDEARPAAACAFRVVACPFGGGGCCPGIVTAGRSIAEHCRNAHGEVLHVTRAGPVVKSALVVIDKVRCGPMLVPVGPRSHQCVGVRIAARPAGEAGEAEEALDVTLRLWHAPPEDAAAYDAANDAAPRLRAVCLSLRDSDDGSKRRLLAQGDAIHRFPACARGHLAVELRSAVEIIDID